MTTKIGFLMGSFDPIHVGHVNMIRLALETNIIDKVIVVPSGHNPWKEKPPIDIAVRIDMINASISPFKGRCEVSDIESTFDPPYYANKPLNRFKELFKDSEKYIICGTDTTEKIQFWKDAVTDILPYYGIIEIPRDDKVTKKIVVEETGKTYDVISTKENGINVSSTEIRNMLKNGKNAYPLLTNEVMHIIERLNLYQ